LPVSNLTNFHLLVSRLFHPNCFYYHNEPVTSQMFLGLTTACDGSDTLTWTIWHGCHPKKILLNFWYLEIFKTYNRLWTFMSQKSNLSQKFTKIGILMFFILSSFLYVSLLFRNCPWRLKNMSKNWKWRNTSGYITVKLLDMDINFHFLQELW